MIYNVSGLSRDKAINMFALKNLQYTLARTGTKRGFVCKFLGGIEATKDYRKCAGIKICELGSEDLNQSHTFVDFNSEVYKKIYDAYEQTAEKKTIK